ncbi:MAG TPA: SH3 domain-containing C40 family peptidase [Terriglobales bacterium]|nr:SH3 domain-containing C40 family peptidase [Terriglobales bacterium]
MKKLTAIMVVALTACLAAAAAESPAAPQAGVVINTAENMHSRSNDGTDVVSQALLGMNVKVLKSERNAHGESWSYIETPDTYKGWVINSSLRFLKPGDRPYASAGKVFVVMALFANTYREPDVTKHKPVKVAPISSVLEVVREDSGRWLQVALPCGAKAWVQGGDGETHDAPWTWPRKSPEDMVALSKRFLGVPYLWGGNSPLGLDCSGFAQLVYKMSGVPILRDADIQMEKSGLLEVPKGQERAGDLVFFGGAMDKIGHVGMMIDGEFFINATTYKTPCVRVDRLREERWQRIYQAARRPGAAGS